MQKDEKLHTTLVLRKRSSTQEIGCGATIHADSLVNLRNGKGVIPVPTWLCGTFHLPTL